MAGVKKKTSKAPAVRKSEEARKEALFLKLIIGVPVAILLILGIWLLLKATVGPGGSIPNFFGKLQGVESNWLVSNFGTGSKPRYYKMGTYDAPEGYTLNESMSSNGSDDLEQRFYYDAVDPDAVVQHFYVCPVEEKTAEVQMDSFKGYKLFYEAGEVQHENVGGFDSYWISGTVDDNQDENAAISAMQNTGEDTEEEEKAPLEIGHRQFTLYTDASRKSCILLMVMTASDTPADEIPSEEALRDAAEQLLAGLKL